MAELITGPFGGQARFEIVDLGALALTETKQLGTYGVVKGVRYFLVGVTSPSPLNLEDFGYLFEEIILLATDIGLGTVWLSVSTFKRSEFARRVGVMGGEIVPAISPVGYASVRRSIIDSTLRWIIKSNQRKPWKSVFFEGSFNRPLPEEAVDLFLTPLEMVHWRIGT